MYYKLNILEDIAEGIGAYCAKWGRISVTQVKEKYGTVRVYSGWGIYGLHSLIWPRYCYKHPKYPQWLWCLDIDYISRFFELFNFIIIPYQKFIYKKAYWKYIKKYPHLFEEITCCADWKEELGFYIPKLCDDHSKEWKKSCWMGGKDCEWCKDEKEDITKEVLNKYE